MEGIPKTRRKASQYQHILEKVPQPLPFLIAANLPRHGIRGKTRGLGEIGSLLYTKFYHASETRKLETLSTQKSFPFHKR